MSLKNLSLAVITAIFLGISSAFVVQEVRAQLACRVDGDCGASSGLRCFSNRCNVPPPIWDGSGGNFLTNGQDVGFDVAKDSRVRGDLAVNGNLTVGQGATGELHVNALYSRNPSASVDSIWIGDGNDTIRIQGDVRFGPDSVPQCTNGQVLKRVAAGGDQLRWGCGNDDVSVGGGGSGSGGTFDPCTRNVYRSTGTASNGSVGGYVGANAQCATGQHVCTAEEVLHTINCGRIPSPLPDGPLWVSAGPPGHTSLSNDCNGWTSDAGGGVYGRTWEFNVQGGIGAQTTCSSSLPFACCFN